MHRHSSRRVPSLGKSFLAERLRGAKSYDRIAGYFSSSILEVAGEELESMSGKVRIICNSELDPDDVKSARAAAMAMRREWCRTDPEKMAEKGANRFERLHRFLTSGKLEVKVLPDSAFGLIHGKAGVIEMADGRVTSFLGSANESKSAWRMNYELVWEDEHPDSIQWVRDEFDALWTHPDAFPLAQAVIEDVERLSKRKVFGSVNAWKEEGDAGCGHTRSISPSSPTTRTGHPSVPATCWRTWSVSAKPSSSPWRPC
jgi:phosphatidylserine/phosphatidylglycerophosphate/cardiolipin synthase-like enzyme